MVEGIAKSVVLHPVVDEDAVFLRQLYCDAQVRRYLGGPSGCLDLLAQARRVIWYRVICAAGEPAGSVALSHHCDGGIEVSYQLLPEYWGQGVARLAVSQALIHGFHTLRLSQVLAETQSRNAPSLRLLARLGFTELRRVQRFGAQQVICGVTSASSCLGPDLRGS